MSRQPRTTHNDGAPISRWRGTAWAGNRESTIAKDFPTPLTGSGRICPTSKSKRKMPRWGGAVRILGINAVSPNPAAALVIDGETAAPAEEERFSRRKHGKQAVPF